MQETTEQLYQLYTLCHINKKRFERSEQKMLKQIQETSKLDNITDSQLKHIERHAFDIVNVRAEILKKENLLVEIGNELKKRGELSFYP